MNKIVLFVVFLLLLVFVFLISQKMIIKRGLYAQAMYIGNMMLHIEIADDQWERERGLSGRESLCEKCGMLFVFPDSRKRTFWMKEMKFDLDMLFLNKGQVVEIYENVPAPKEGQDGREIKVFTKGEADMVLEVNSRWVEENDIKVGDNFELKNQ